MLTLINDSNNMNHSSKFIVLVVVRLIDQKDRAASRASDEYSSVRMQFIHIWWFVYIVIHNWPLEPFSQDYWPSSSHRLRCLLVLYISGWTYRLKSTPNDRFFEKLFMAILFTLRVFARNHRRNTFRFDIWPAAGTLAFRLIS